MRWPDGLDLGIRLTQAWCIKRDAPTTVPIKKIKGAACQRCIDGDGVIWCEQAFRLEFSWFTLNSAFRNRNLIHLVLTSLRNRSVHGKKSHVLFECNLWYRLNVTSGGSRIFQMGGRCFVTNGGAHILFSGKKCMKLKEIGLKWGGARLLAPCYSKITIFL